MLIYVLLLVGCWFALGLLVFAWWLLVVPPDEMLPTDRLERLRQVVKR